VPNQDEAKTIYNAIKKNGKLYDRLNEEGKKAYWQYSADRKLVSIDQLNDSGKAEYQRYVNPNKPEYAMQASVVQTKPSQYIQTQTEKVMSAVTPSIVKNMISQDPEQIAANQKRKLVEQRLEEYTPPQPMKPQLPQITNKGSAVVQQGKVPQKGLIRPDNPFAPAPVNALNTASLGLLERNTDAISSLREKAPIASTVGSMAGYLAPFGAAKGALVKGSQTLGKRLLTDAAIGAGVDASSELIKGKNDIGTATKNVAIGAGTGILADGALTLIGKAVRGFRAGQLAKIPVEEIATAKADIQPTSNVISKGQYKVRNTRLTKAIEEYNTAIETIQNHFQTNELRSDEMSRIKTELGIDIDSILKNMEDAEKGIDIREIGEQRNLANVAGVKTAPKLTKPDALQSPTNDLPKQGKNTLPIPKPLDTVATGTQNIANKPKGKLKSAADKFYSATVNNTQATANVSKEAEIMNTVARNSGTTVDHIIKKGLVNMEGQKIEGKAIADIFKMPDNEAKAFEELLFETHNIDRVKQGKELTGRTTEESKQAIKDIKELYPHLEAKAKEVNTLLKNMLDEWGVKSGLVDTDLRNLVQSMYQNYVPGYRELTGVDATSFKSRGMGPAKIINKAIGGDDKLMSLQKSIPMLINKTVKSARKNELYREILKAANEGSPYAKVLEPAGKIEEVVQKNATDKIIEAIKADGIDALADITDNALTADPKLGYLLTVMDNGKPVKLQIKEELFKSLQALNGKGDDDLQTALKLFKKGITNPFKSLVTGYNPIFALKNIFIDTPTAYIQGAENNPIKFVKNRIDAAKDMATNAPAFQEYQALGGEGGNFANVEKGLNAGGRFEKTKKVLGGFNNATETWNRYGEYKGTIKREGSDYATKMKALSDAQEVTTNFGRHGDVTKAIDAIVPYFNPAVQGLDKSVRTFKNPAAWAKALGVITAPTAAVYAINQIVDKKGYDQLDNRTKDTYYVFPMGNGEFFKVPKNRQSGVIFGALFERVLRQAQGDPEAFKGFGNTLKNNMLIQNPWTNNIASAAVTGIGYNKDFAGRAVIPQYMINDKRSPRLQYDEKTSEIAKAMGDELNLSPKQIDYIIKSYGGIVASILLPATTKGGNVLENVIKRPFTADAAYSNEITNSFYTKLDKLKQAATDKNIVGKLPSKLVTPEEKISNLYASMTRHISDIRDGITQLGATDKARESQQRLLVLLEQLNKPIDYNKADKLKTQLMIMAKEYKK
jgi:hypothetical protein